MKFTKVEDSAIFRESSTMGSRGAAARGGAVWGGILSGCAGDAARGRYQAAPASDKGRRRAR